MSAPTKSPLVSKTVIVNAVIALGGFIPAVREFATANPQLVLSIIGAVGIFLRFITNGKISFSND